MSGFDQGAWDAITALRNNPPGDQMSRRALLFLADRLDLAKADRRDLKRILEGKQPYRSRSRA